MKTIILNNELLYKATTQMLDAHQDTLLGDPVTHGIAAQIVADNKILHQTVWISGAEQVVGQSTEALSEEDAIHDHLVSAIDSAFDAIIHLAEAARPPRREKAEFYGAIRAVLQPDGRSQVNKPFLQESVEAQKNWDALLPAQREALRSVRLGDSDLYAVCQDWLASAARIGNLLQVRATAEAEGSLQPDGLEARIRIKRALASLWTLLPHSSLSAEKQATIRAPFADAIADQERRNAEKARRKADTTEAPGA